MPITQKILTHMPTTTQLLHKTAPLILAGAYSLTRRAPSPANNRTSDSKQLATLPILPHLSHTFFPTLKGPFLIKEISRLYGRVY